MLFNSVDFAIFLPIVFILYWFVTKKNLKFQNLLILIASYFFYGWWDWRFLSLILFSTLVDFIVGINLEKYKNLNTRKLLLIISIAVNLGFLGFFKYYNFFLDNFVEAFSFFGVQIKSRSLNIILPVGISFYTFQTLSYSIDIYKRKMPATKDFISFAAFVAFFPQLVAGPIERASNLLPQFFKKRQFEYNYAIDGLKHMLWGFFKKIVIADNCGEVANQIFNNSLDYSGSTLLLGAVLFAFQIYGDFSGYSDIAIGTAKLFGFNLMRNFAYPYFSRDIAEFWRRWHISLSTWFRDYLYIPLGGSRGGFLMKIRNTFVIFIVSGFWHGANWTFIIWGALNAIYFLPLMIMKKNRENIDIVSKGKLLPSIREFLNMAFTFILTLFAWIFFRANSVSDAFLYIKGIFSISFFSFPTTFPSHIILLLLLFISIEWIGREQSYPIKTIGLKWKRPIRWVLYMSLGFLILTFSTESKEFIYFQF